MRLLDLFSGAGGAGMGYHRAGFEVIGVDIAPQPRYPFPFIQADALEFVKEHGHEFDVVHASPPCQAHSNTHRIRSNDHPDLIKLTREALVATSRPWVIENVEGAPLIDPITLCGTQFGLRTYRHRLFESNIELTPPAHKPHEQYTVKMGRPLEAGDFYHAVGNFSNVDYIRRDMGVEWMNRDGIRECIPPAYTVFIGSQLKAAL